jgi:hypothetical protein
MFSWLWPPITWRKSVLVVLALSAGIYVVLALANISPPKDHCAWAFPKVLSCLLAARENLSGGLIGAGGALIAAWVAWSAIYEQMTQAEKMALRSENQALDVIKLDLALLLMTPKYILGSIKRRVAFEDADKPISFEDAEKKWARSFDVIQACMPPLASPLDVLAKIELFAEHLGPQRRALILRLIEDFRKLFEEVETFKQSLNDQPRKFAKEIQQLSSINKLTFLLEKEPNRFGLGELPGNQMVWDESDKALDELAMRLRTAERERRAHRP